MAKNSKRQYIILRTVKAFRRPSEKAESLYSDIRQGARPDYRTPKIHLGPLNIGTIAEDYQSVLGLGEQEGLALARPTKGYSFAFHVLDYFAWENTDDSQAAQRLSRQYLDDYAYDKVWSELSHKDREVLYGISQIKSGRIKDIRELLSMNTNEFNPYRQHLMRKGIISGEERGYVRLLLPFFDQYILAHYDLG